MDSEDSIAKKAWLGVGGPYMGSHNVAISAKEPTESSKIGGGSSSINQHSYKSPQYGEAALGI
jgi:hypothetical protein